MLFRGILFEYSIFDRFVLQRDLARVEAFYRSKGYFDVHARAGRVFQIDKNHVRIEVVVEEGCGSRPDPRNKQRRPAPSEESMPIDMRNLPQGWGVTGRKWIS